MNFKFSSNMNFLLKKVIGRKVSILTRHFEKAGEGQGQFLIFDFYQKNYNFEFNT